ncbi:hypothetical protein FJ930_13305 [Mesorhizobium sp. B2-4-15]|uniref:hypothetical protein n=1 Tax=Mesorhizobium sp. B2-4-15 TaxID=2589934 RepID=UPI00115476C5|nr:hypothetical protein [Mesorhizobium sp. B2-4-15]TPK72135.1 hypothetical protein FJ930_13305 [Mesorhizobium sp. B2-4-15]
MRRSGRAMIAMCGVLLLTGCGTAREKSAPCKRPDTLTSFAPDHRAECGPMKAVNADRQAAQAAIAALGNHVE